jgi:TrmH family RNA methyltransferase
MLSKAQNKYIRSLTQQKYRKEHNVFIAEGDKIAREWLQSGAGVQMIVALQAWADSHADLIAKHKESQICIVEPHELEAVSTLQTPNQVLLVVDMPKVEEKLPGNEWCIALEGIQDPGNMGTIIRIADWFGIGHVLCSADCADIYNPKVVQAAMGGHLRVKMHVCDLQQFVAKSGMPAIAATLHGEDVWQMPQLRAGIIMIGNESKGLPESLVEQAKYKVTIPKKGGAESLNAAVSTGILCALLIR